MFGKKEPVFVGITDLSLCKFADAIIHSEGIDKYEKLFFENLLIVEIRSYLSFYPKSLINDHLIPFTAQDANISELKLKELCNRLEKDENINIHYDYMNYKNIFNEFLFWLDYLKKIKESKGIYKMLLNLFKRTSIAESIYNTIVNPIYNPYQESIKNIFPNVDTFMDKFEEHCDKLEILSIKIE